MAANWRIEASLHWVLDVTFRDDLARVRKGHGAKNMAVVRHFAVNLVRTAKDKRSLNCAENSQDGTRIISQICSSLYALTRIRSRECTPGSLDIVLDLFYRAKDGNNEGFRFGELPDTNIADANTGLNTECNVFEFDDIETTKPTVDRQPACRRAASSRRRSRRKN
jgi:hypothetical protein